MPDNPDNSCALPRKWISGKATFYCCWRVRSMAEPFDLQRFADAQVPVYEQVCRELAAGEKRSHWIWFVFPQLRGLGHSHTAIKFGIASRAEAVAYLAHPVLGARFRECVRLILAVEGRTLEEIMAFPDDLKFISSMTLFAEVADDPALFLAAIEKYAAGVPDAATLELLSSL